MLDVYFCIALFFSGMITPYLLRDVVFPLLKKKGLFEGFTPKKKRKNTKKETTLQQLIQKEVEAYEKRKEKELWREYDERKHSRVNGKKET